MNTMTIDGHEARIEYDPDLDLFRGEILGLNGGADFYGKTPSDLRREFRKSLQVFLEVCQEKGIEPFKKYSGRFNLRISPELHSEIAVRAAAEGKSLNQWVSQALEYAAHNGA
ncbi:MAG: type II toxin-antitoxin system HicB family antitoxin [Candidatus Latescibacteria bacterium]|nr:type II toxin-antitoxin system HicB family antitoxin [Candidatus Latescibacterota bacterium]